MNTHLIHPDFQIQIKYRIKDRIKDWKRELSRHRNLIIFSLLLLAISVLINYLSGHYVDTVASARTTDLLLDYMPVIDLNLIYTYGYEIVLLIMFLFPLFFDVKEFHVTISQYSLLVLIRSFFILLTHLRTPIDAVAIPSVQVFNFLYFKNDLFFSGHTALPFLGYLLFRHKRIRYFFLIATFIMAATVLFMHVHYSIDVFAALFIAYGSYMLGKSFFKKVVSEDKSFHKI